MQNRCCPPLLPRLLTLSLAFVLTTAASAGQFKTLHAFTGPTADGSYPNGALILDRAGNVYGVTGSGGSGTGCSTYGCGTLFQLQNSNGRWRESVLYNFSTSTSAFTGPEGRLTVDPSGHFYGAAYGGDPSCNCGSVYQLTRSGGVWTENVLHNFVQNATDGQFIQPGLVRDSSGNLYGLTDQGGSHGAGVVFELSPNSDGTWTETLIHEFGVGSDGAYAYGPLAMDAAGNIYGTTNSGGSYGYGAVFKLSFASGAWAESVIYNFTLDYGSYPIPYGVVPDALGNLYGITLNGGAYAVGTVYKLTPTAGFWNRTVLYTLTGGSDGADPVGGVTVDPTGNLYGTTYSGGLYGNGIVFKLAQNKNGQWRQTVLHSFANGSDGQYTNSGVILDASGNLYGVTIQGGAYGFGTVYEITP